MDSIFTYQNFLLLIVWLSMACAGAIVWLIRHRSSPRWLDVAASILLLLISAVFLGLTQAILDLLPSKEAADRDIRNQYQVALLVIPFFTANLATALLAHAILSDRDYSGQMSLNEALYKLILALGKAIFVLTPICWVFYVYYYFWVRPSETE